MENLELVQQDMCISQILTVHVHEQENVRSQFLENKEESTMAKAQAPFLIVNPKSYLYGKESLELAKAADQVAKDTGPQIYFTCPYADIRMIQRKYN